MNRTSFTFALALLAGALTSLAADELLLARTNANFQVRNRKFSDLLRPHDASNRDGAPIVLYPGQPWKCMIWRFTAGTNDAFRLQNLFTSKSLAAAAKSSPPTIPLEQVKCAADAHDAPAWKFTRLADGAYRVGRAGSDLVWTAAPSPEGATRVVLAPWRDADDQKWELLKAPEHPTM